MSDGSGEIPETGDELKFERVLRHGDVIVFKLKSDGESGRSGKAASELILAHGEVTGHAHRLRGDLEVFATGEAAAHTGGRLSGNPGQTTTESGGDASSGRMLFRALSSATLTHEEHDPIVLEPGLYLKVNQVEFDPFARMIRDVQD